MGTTDKGLKPLYLPSESVELRGGRNQAEARLWLLCPRRLMPIASWARSLTCAHADLYLFPSSSFGKHRAISPKIFSSPFSLASPASQSFFKKRFYLFILREMGREVEREGEKHWCARGTSISCLWHAPQLGTWPATQAWRPDRELNQWLFSLQDDAQLTEPQWSGLIPELLHPRMRAHITHYFRVSWCQKHLRAWIGLSHCYPQCLPLCEVHSNAWQVLVAYMNIQIKRITIFC